MRAVAVRGQHKTTCRYFVVIMRALIFDEYNFIWSFLKCVLF